jgi:thioredoxin reductase (NADPH)
MQQPLFKNDDAVCNFYHLLKCKVEYICTNFYDLSDMEIFKPMDLQRDTQKSNIENTEKVRCLIIGSGPAGYTAAIYASRANLKPVLYTGLQMGGQLTTTTEVDNFPGYPDGITGPEMMDDLKKQAERFGADIRFGIATEVDFSNRPHRVTIDDNKVILADSVIIATGATAKYLGLEAETKYAGMGVSACATCDGFFYRGKDVAVVGGGDTAAEEATYLAGLCNKVYLIVRRDILRASKVMQDKVLRTKNIEILWEHQPIDLFGENGVEGITLVRKKGTPEEEIVKKKIDGFFLAIGHKPNSEVFNKYLETDNVGYIKTTPGTSKTTVPGVFAAGDVQDPHYRQAVTAAGSGCMAAIDAERYLSELE